ncbi:odorant receptor 67a [Drosophila sulfurigaster albostrigata]|uniref:odorant receptor 67a n=1 Tax=Drosophila sulfurigaster albostrigata TaxID=89887 RepID=UPI002D21C006|nr:odorant receptor 67a [Drosophila sulfurigaster albostrigata]
MLSNQLTVAEKPEKFFVTFNDFMSLPLFFYHTIGVDPYESTSSNYVQSRWLYVNFMVHVTNMGFNFVMECMFVVLYYKDTESIVDVCMTICYVGFVLVSQLKTISVWRQKSKLNALVREMESIFPSPNRVEQQKYRVDYYLRRCRFFLRGFSGLYLVLVVTYSFYIYVKYLIQHWLMQSTEVEKAMPYFSISPWDWHNNWSYYLMYLLQVLGAYTATTGHISADILIYAVNMQLVMHFDYLSNELAEFKNDAAMLHGTKSYAKDLKLLQDLISYHNKLLGLSDVMNNVFGMPLLLNFLTSSVMVCFVGFQMTLGLSADHTVKLALFLISAVSEIYLICYFSDLLIVASESVASAVYKMEWFEGDSRFRKMLIFIALRAQKPVCLKATVFLDISMETMTMFLKMSYRLFCVIRTMYQ